MKFRRRVSEPQIIVVDDGPATDRPSTVRNRWRQMTKKLSSTSFWDAVLKLATGSSEPVINEQQNSDGQTVYSIYDPTTQQQIDNLSEAEVRTWLEERYNR